MFVDLRHFWSSVSVCPQNNISSLIDEPNYGLILDVKIATTKKDGQSKM